MRSATPQSIGHLRPLNRRMPSHAIKGRRFIDIQGKLMHSDQMDRRLLDVRLDTDFDLWDKAAVDARLPAKRKQSEGS